MALLQISRRICWENNVTSTTSLSTKQLYIIEETSQKDVQQHVKTLTTLALMTTDTPRGVPLNGGDESRSGGIVANLPGRLAIISDN